MNTRQHWPVNWVDGMKINKQHFQDQQACFDEQLAWLGAASLTDHNYGLLPTVGGGSSLELTLTPERLEVRSCQAITRGGYMLFINAENNSGLKRRMSDLMYDQDFSDADTWLVLLRIHPEENIPIGTPNHEETPLRHPHTTLKTSLEIVPNLNGQQPETFTHALPLARIIRGYQGIERDRDFIPPVGRLLASEELLQLHQQWKASLLTMEGDAFEIIKKIKDKHRNNQGNQLSADLLNLAQASIRYTNMHFDQFRLVLPTQPPLALFLWFISLARTIKNELRLAGNQENMLSYLAHFIDGVGPTDFMRFCNDLCDVAYNHTDIRSTVVKVHQFMEFIALVFSKLRALDYHENANPTIINSGAMSGRFSTRGNSRPVPDTGNSGVGGMKITRGGSTKQTPSSPSSDDGGNSTGWGLE